MYFYYMPSFTIIIFNYNILNNNNIIIILIYLRIIFFYFIYLLSHFDFIEELNSKKDKNANPITPAYYLDNMAEESEKTVQVTKEDFQKALDELIPSVSEKDLKHYSEIQERFSDMLINSAEKNKQK